MKSYIITAECSSGAIYVMCREDQIKGFVEDCDFGCKECIDYQEVPAMSIDEVDYFVTENGSTFSRNTWKQPIQPEK